MVEHCQELGLGCNVDLIYGWPRQTVDHMLRDLDTMVRLRVPHLTHYELNVAGRTDFARRPPGRAPVRRAEPRDVPGSLSFPPRERLSPGHVLRLGAGRGRRQRRLRLRDAVPRLFRRDAGREDLRPRRLGLGVRGAHRLLGYPQDPGWVFTNAPRIDDYYRQLDEGRFPAVRGFRYSEPDLRLYTLFRMLQGLERRPALYAQLFGVDPLEEHAPVWQALADRGWVAVEEDRLSLVGDGGFYTPLIQGLVAADRLAAMRRTRRGGQPASLARAARRWRHDARGDGQARDGAFAAGARVRADAGPRHTVRASPRPRRGRRRALADPGRRDRARRRPGRPHPRDVLERRDLLEAGRLPREARVRCWVLDLRGHGASQRVVPNPSFEAFGLLDVPAAIEAVRAHTGRPLFLVGHSGGGLAFLMHLVRQPSARADVRGLVPGQPGDGGLRDMERAAVRGFGRLTDLPLGYTPGRALGLGPEDEPKGVLTSGSGGTARTGGPARTASTIWPRSGTSRCRRSASPAPGTGSSRLRRLPAPLRCPRRR